MNKVILPISLIGLGVLVVGGFLFFQQSSQKNAMMQKEESMMEVDQNQQETTMQKEEEMMKEETKDEDSMMKKDGMAEDRYVEYSKTAFENASQGRRVLFFYASWCPTCIPADKSISDNMKSLPADMTVIRVNYNDPETDQEEKDLAKLYGITYQHTFVQIDEMGKEVTKWNGGMVEELLKNSK